jgi:hypothetical protein
MGDAAYVPDMVLQGEREMKRAQLLVIIGMVFGLTLLCVPAFAQGEPPTSESTMNLSYPANFYGPALQTGTIGNYLLQGTLDSGMSYGCELPETIGTTTYPNTSCVTPTSTGFTADSYVACEAKCGSYPVERIYWQKNTANVWQGGFNSVAAPGKLPVEYIDWGDNLESKTWPVQVLRVETNTFSTLPEVAAFGPNARTRFDMWHVFGQGTNELWGVHATHSDPPAAYFYLNAENELNWPFGVNVSPTARLNISKLEKGSSMCPATGTGKSQQTLYNPVWSIDPVTKTGHWAAVPFETDMLYGAELNIKGSYVYGYNWNLRSMNTGSVDKPGWWRLTFYTPDDSIDFSWWQPSNIDLGDTFAPPVDPSTTPIVDPGDLTALIDAKAEEGGDTGLPLYVPQVNTQYNLTYLDICIKSGNAGGGGGKKGPR